MKIAGIVAEYNPFHCGHLYQIDKTIQSGATHIAAVMSGSFVQRGDIAAFSKWARAKAAVLNGVDLVVELDVQYALSSANRFARAGVFILNQLGADMISFGSECGEIEKLKETAKIAVSAESSSQMSGYLKKGMSYPAAREAAINSLYGAVHGVTIANPNNMLGIEYIKAINEINPLIEAFTIPRGEVSHDSGIAGEKIASASYLREQLFAGNYERLRQFVPASALDIYMNEIEGGFAPVLESRLETAILYKLKTMSQADFLRITDVNEGLENRLYSAARGATCLEEFYSLAKTKRYTLAKLRRIVYSALIGITASDTDSMPQYINILAMSSKGMEILAKAKKTASIPIMPKFADLYKKSPGGIEINLLATDIAALASPKIQASGGDFTNSVVVCR